MFLRFNYLRNNHYRYRLVFKDNVYYVINDQPY